MTIPNVSAALTVLARAEANEQLMHDDVRAWGAPSECHADVARGAAERWRTARRRAHALTGLRWRAMVRRLRRDYGLSLDPYDRQWSRIVDHAYRTLGWYHYK